MHGKTIAENGYKMEQLVTEWTDCYITHTNWFAGGRWPDEVFLASDASYIARTVATHVEMNYGEIKEVVHVGNRINKGIEELTGKKSPADIALNVRDYGWMGVSMKYGTTSKGSRRIRVHSPTPTTLATNLNFYYGAAFNWESSGLCGKVEELTEAKMDASTHLIMEHQDLLGRVFDEPKLSLNKESLSHLRKIMRQEISFDGRDEVITFYNKLKNASKNNNSLIANEMFKTITTIFNNTEVPFRSNIFRALVNIPELHTLLVDARHGEAVPKVEIYDYAKDVEDYLKEVNGEVALNKKAGTCVFKVGVLNVEVNTRAGSKNAGAVNITIDKKILNNVGLQKLSERSEEKQD